MTDKQMKRIQAWLDEVKSSSDECGLPKGCPACEFNARGARIIRALLKELNRG